jgi:hypothetical protein
MDSFVAYFTSLFRSGAYQMYPKNATIIRHRIYENLY